jgi:hypothetical protein
MNRTIGVLVDGKVCYTVTQADIIGPRKTLALVEASLHRNSEIINNEISSIIANAESSVDVKQAVTDAHMIIDNTYPSYLANPIKKSLNQAVNVAKHNAGGISNTTALGITVMNEEQFVKTCACMPDEIEAIRSISAQVLEHLILMDATDPVNEYNIKAKRIKLLLSNTTVLIVFALLPVMAKIANPTYNNIALSVTGGCLATILSALTITQMREKVKKYNTAAASYQADFQKLTAALSIIVKNEDYNHLYNGIKHAVEMLKVRNLMQAQGVLPRPLHWRYIMPKMMLCVLLVVFMILAWQVLRPIMFAMKSNISVTVDDLDLDPQLIYTILFVLVSTAITVLLVVNFSTTPKRE